MSKHALIVWGGWGGHEPKEVAALMAEGLSPLDFHFDKKGASIITG